MDLWFIRKSALSDHLGGHSPADAWKINHFQNRTGVGILSTSCTVLKIVISTRLRRNGLRGCPEPGIPAPSQMSCGMEFRVSSQISCRMKFRAGVRLSRQDFYFILLALGSADRIFISFRWCSAQPTGFLFQFAGARFSRQDFHFNLLVPSSADRIFISDLDQV